MGRWVLRTSRVLLVNSHAARRNAEGLAVKAEKIRVLPNVIDLAAFDAAMSKNFLLIRQANRLIAMCVGRLISEKRVDFFLTALALARRAVAHLKGVIAGDGPELPRLEKKAAALGLLPGHVEFLGRRPDVPALLRQADMLVHSSRNEGFPNAVLETMTAGLPVITTPAGNAGIVVEHGVTGYVVPFEDVQRTAESMVQLSLSADLRRRLGEAGRKRVEEHYSYECLADRLLATYRSIVRQQQRHDLLPLLAG